MIEFVRLHFTLNIYTYNNRSTRKKRNSGTTSLRHSAFYKSTKLCHQFICTSFNDRCESGYYGPPGNQPSQTFHVRRSVET